MCRSVITVSAVSYGFCTFQMFCEEEKNPLLESVVNLSVRYLLFLRFVNYGSKQYV